jgi:hypothetical protein
MSDNRFALTRSDLLNTAGSKTESSSLFEGAYPTLSAGVSALKSEITEHPYTTAACAATAGLAVYTLCRGRAGSLLSKFAATEVPAYRSTTSRGIECLLSRRALVPLSIGALSVTSITGCSDTQKENEEYAKRNAARWEAIANIGDCLNTEGPGGSVWHLAQRDGKLSRQNLNDAIASRNDGRLTDEQVKSAETLLANWDSESVKALRVVTVKQIFSPLNPLDALDPLYEQNPFNHTPWNYQTVQILENYITPESAQQYMRKPLKR